MRPSPREIPVIDLFAGPGGLGEGFSALEHHSVRFKIALSVEMEANAHSTLTLRAFYRQFARGEAPDEYYDFVRGDIGLDELTTGRWKGEWEAACQDARKLEIDDASMPALRQLVAERLNGVGDWVLIGGPPCQAYSLVGRARRSKERREEREKFEGDHRQRLYEYYLAILAEYQPTAFVMENVKGLLSAKLGGRHLFEHIIQDLRRPAAVCGAGDDGPEYDLYTLAPYAKGDDEGDPGRFVLKSELHGVPQRRQRVIVVGIRHGAAAQPMALEINKGLPIQSVIGGLPPIRSGVSLGGGRVDASDDTFLRVVMRTAHHRGRGMDAAMPEVLTALERVRLEGASDNMMRYSQGFFPWAHDESAELGPTLANWLLDARLGGFINHESRSHMESDLERYVFAAAFAQAEQRSPKVADFPLDLVPRHRNADGGRTSVFADRFRVQTRDRVATTITCHIAKDGHYYIHYDPLQCRSLTVREAARLQTFPDNYFFCGKRTAQYTQVGNAVPPLLAHQIAQRLADALGRSDAAGLLSHD